MELFQVRQSPQSVLGTVGAVLPYNYRLNVPPIMQPTASKRE